MFQHFSVCSEFFTMSIYCFMTRKRYLKLKTCSIGKSCLLSVEISSVSKGSIFKGTIFDIFQASTLSVFKYFLKPNCGG